jgi:hypothetical protein
MCVCVCVCVYKYMNMICICICIWGRRNGRRRKWDGAGGGGNACGRGYRVGGSGRGGMGFEGLMGLGTPVVQISDKYRTFLLQFPDASSKNHRRTI